MNRLLCLVIVLFATESSAYCGVASDITFVTIPGGTFQMGNVEDAAEGNSNELPVHTVTLSGFEMSAHEITNAQSAGTHSVVFDGANLSSGVYLYRFVSPGYEKAGRMLLIK